MEDKLFATPSTTKSTSKADQDVCPTPSGKPQTFLSELMNFANVFFFKMACAVFYTGEVFLNMSQTLGFGNIVVHRHIHVEEWHAHTKNSSFTGFHAIF